MSGHGKGKARIRQTPRLENQTGAEYRAPCQLDGWTPNELGNQATSSGRPDEIDGTQVLQMEDKTR